MAAERPSVKLPQIVNVVLTYWVISISMVFSNKFLVGGANTKVGGDKQLDVSIFVAWMQSIVCVVLVLSYGAVSRALSTTSKVQSVHLSTCLSKPVLLVSVLFSLMLSSNNYCLKLVGVAFFQIARSFTLIFTVIFSALILKKRVSCAVFACCAMVVSGFIIGVDQEKASGTLSTLGVLSGVTSSLFVALNGIYTKRALEMEEMDSVKLTLHINVNASFLLLFPSVLTGQVSNILEMGRLADPTFWVATLLSGFLGFLIAWASARQIDFTSPITHHISNNTKSIIQSLLAVWVFSDYKTGLWWAGCVVVLLGAFSYALVRMREERMSSEKVVLAVQSERSSIV